MSDISDLQRAIRLKFGPAPDPCPLCGKEMLTAMGQVAHWNVDHSFLRRAWWHMRRIWR